MSSSKSRGRLPKLGVALLAAGFLTVAGPVTAAQASEGDCVGGANGFIDIPDNQSGTTVRTIQVGPSGVEGTFTVTLKYATIAGWQRGFAKLEAGGTEAYFWMDWTTNGGASWLQCGPFHRDGNNPVSMTTPAKITSSSSSYMFRACEGVYTEWGFITHCTTWW